MIGCEVEREREIGAARCGAQAMEVDPMNTLAQLFFGPPTVLN